MTYRGRFRSGPDSLTKVKRKVLNDRERISVTHRPYRRVER